MNQELARRVTFESCLLHTVINDDFVASRSHRLGVVTLVELAESGQTSSAHPDLEGLPSLQVRRRVLFGVVVGIALAPVGRRQDIAGLILGWVVQVLVAAPGDVGVVLHKVRLCLVALGSGRVQELRAGKGVVEHGVCDKSARVVGLLDAVDGVAIKRGALGTVDVAVRPSGSRELSGVERIGIATVVLVEVGKLVVEQDRRFQVLGDGESQIASVAFDVDAWIDCDVDTGLDGPLRIDRGV